MHQKCVLEYSSIEYNGKIDRENRADYKTSNRQFLTKRGMLLWAFHVSDDFGEIGKPGNDKTGKSWK